MDRAVHFEWAGIPLHWMKADPIASRVLNVLNPLLPEGEHSFLTTFGEALPFVTPIHRGRRPGMSGDYRRDSPALWKTGVEVRPLASDQ